MTSDYPILEFIAKIVGHLAWPIVLVLLGWMFRSGISSALSQLFAKSSIREFRAGGTGISATFEMERQVSAGSEDEPPGRALLLPPGQTYEDIVENQRSQETPYSERLRVNVAQHINALGVGDSSKVEILIKEVALLQSVIKVLDVATVLFRSQFDLFAELRDSGHPLPPREAERYFDGVAARNPSVYSGWDCLKYLSYPMSARLIEYREGEYVLTEFGKSLVDIMRRHPRIIDDLAPL